MNNVQQKQRVIESVTADDLQLSPTVIHALRHWACVQPAKNAYTFLSGSDWPEQPISYGELAARVSGLAAVLRRDGLRGERILLVMRSGLEYIISFLACAAAGVIAVPLYPPASDKDWAKLRAVARDCQASALILTRTIEANHGPRLAEVPDCRCRLFEELVAAAEANTGGVGDLAEVPDVAPDVQPDDIAFFQYTSGSTGDPKGVMVTHRNIIHNNRMTALGMGNTPDSVIVTWLPLHHDMGLIGMILQSLSLGARAILMSPRSFVRDPAMWLGAISTYRGTCAGGPNFAFDLCIDKVSDAALAALDLSSWQVAFNGAEPIKASTLERFHRRFARTGFRAESYFPCYGLAEATLFVAGGPFGQPPTVFDVDRDEVNRGSVVPVGPGEVDPARVRTVVGMAIDQRDQMVRIVDPETWTMLPDMSIGEVWLKSDSVTRGYWSRTKATADTFHAYTTDTGDGPFLRTGDLGFIRNDRLYITGRIKELIIVNGFNHYPQDIEETVQALSQDFRVHYGAAFSFEDERLAVIQAVTSTEEVAPRFDDLIAQTRRAVLTVHGIAPSYVALVNTGAIPKTSSGKIQRGELRKQLLENRLEVLHAWRSEALQAGARPTVTPLQAPEAPPLPPGATSSSAPIAHSPARAANGNGVAHPDRAAHGATDGHIERDRRGDLEDKLAWIRTYCATRINSFVIDERRTIPPHVVLDFGNQGLLGMQVPREHGGLGFSTREFLRVLELLGSKDMTLALFVGLNNVLGVRPVLQFGSERLRAQYLPLLATGRELAAFSLTEPAAGSNPQAIEATARASGQGYRVTGTKIWSGSAAWSGVMNVFAKHIDAQGQSAGITAFAVPQTSPGVRQGPEALTMGLRGMIQNTIFFEDVEVEPWQVLGGVGHGMSVAQDALCYGRLGIAAACLGATKLCVQLMLQYAGQRRVSTGPLLHNPYTRVVLTEVMHQVAGIEALIDGVAERIDAGHEVAPEVLAVCKSVSTEVLWAAVDRTMQLAGGRGYIESNFIPQLFRDARVFRIFEGPTETLHHFVGTSALRGRKPIRAYLCDVLDDATVTAHYDVVVQELHASLSQGERDTVLEDWQCLALGEYLDHLLVYGAACGRGAAAATRGWLRDRLEVARAKLESARPAFAAISSADALHSFGEALDREIGPREQHAALPGMGLDPLFAGPAISDAGKPAPVEPRPAEAPPPLRAVKGTEPPPIEQLQPAASATKTEIEAFITEWIARRCAQPVASIGRDVEFAMLGMGSVDSIDLGTALSEKYALTLDTTALWSYPNIRELAGFVLSKLTRKPGAAAR
jgi:acyl-CoA synthetase (AMP-forming)/AMP-acid ligase II/alkylation response protein AidB-like acyl-CoA dehydrogenase/acyl carrier protein